MAQCPRCKEDMPLLSKICPVCGFVDEGSDENKMSVSDFVKVLEARLNEIKYIPEPSFMKGMGNFTFIIYPILAVAFMAVFLISDSGLFIVGFGLFLVLSIIAWIKKSKGTLGYAPFNRWFKVVENDFDYHKRIAQHSFGKSPEVSKLISEISTEIKTIEKKRSSALRRYTIIWVIIIILLLGLCVWGVMSADSAVNQKQATKQTSEYLMNEYKSGRAENVEQARIDIINAMLAEGNAAGAEDFFITDVMGNMQDLDAAAVIVQHYNGVADPESAKNFVSRCTSMRYGSDREKLSSLIK